MSWSVHGVGKSAAVAALIEKQFTSAGPCAEPEETVRQAARATIAAALAGQEGAVQVSASGSQSSTYNEGNWGPPHTNTLVIQINPLVGFAE